MKGTIRMFAGLLMVATLECPTNFAIDMTLAFAGLAIMWSGLRAMEKQMKENA